ncbi:MAG: DUF308 domain-containing protein [Bacteroidales bacterium]|nr:DUF308 domain-containing protein [Bacteroidales bacterium]
MEKRHWWVSLILGIIILALGAAVLLFPQASYLTMTFTFGAVIILSGVMYLGMAMSKGVKGRGWLIASGIIEIILGIILTAMPAVSAISLPLCLGFWLLFKGSSLIGIGYEMSKIKGSGWGWTLFSAVLLIICGIIILVQPLLYGMEAVIWWVGISFIIGGCTLMNYGFKVKGDEN